MSLSSLYQFLREWERSFPQMPSGEDLENFKKNLHELQKSSLPEISKLSSLTTHFHLKLSAQELFNLIVPFERALQKSLRDDEFLVSDRDHLALLQEAFPLYLVLENFRSAFNVGSFFRLGEAMGAQEILLCGYTATPDNEKIKKTTMGTEEWLAWSHHLSTVKALRSLKEKNIRVIAIETAASAVALTEKFTPGPTALVFGNERFGLNAETLREVDEIRHIPLLGRKNSLNVASCGAICVHEWIRQWQK